MLSKAEKQSLDAWSKANMIFSKKPYNPKRYIRASKAAWAKSALVAEERGDLALAEECRRYSL